MSDERTTAFQERDTGPLPALPPATRRALPTQALLLGALAALGIGAIIYLAWPADPLRDPRPAAVVQAFSAAIAARDVTQMLSYVEPTVFRREIGPELRAYIEYLDSAQFDDSSYTLVDNDGQRAHVRWKAKLHYQLNLGSQVTSGVQPIDTLVELVKIGDDWYLRDINLPEHVTR